MVDTKLPPANALTALIDFRHDAGARLSDEAKRSGKGIEELAGESGLSWGQTYAVLEGKGTLRNIARLAWSMGFQLDLVARPHDDDE